jgi:hypothetical protein
MPKIEGLLLSLFPGRIPRHYRHFLSLQEEIPRALRVIHTMLHFLFVQLFLCFRVMASYGRGLRLRGVSCNVTMRVPVLGLKEPVLFPYLGSPLLWARTTGLKVWPGALVLSSIMIKHMKDPDGNMYSVSQENTRASMLGSWAWEDKRILELGCGLGLCSIIAARGGAQVLATDHDPDLITIAKKNMQNNTQVCECAESKLRCKVNQKYAGFQISSSNSSIALGRW